MHELSDTEGIIVDHGNRTVYIGEDVNLLDLYNMITKEVGAKRFDEYYVSASAFVEEDDIWDDEEFDDEEPGGTTFIGLD